MASFVRPITQQASDIVHDENEDVIDSDPEFEGIQMLIDGNIASSEKLFIYTLIEFERENGDVDQNVVEQPTTEAVRGMSLLIYSTQIITMLDTFHWVRTDGHLSWALKYFEDIDKCFYGELQCLIVIFLIVHI